jgi:hypothetical protein
MSRYTLRAIELTDYASHEMLLVTASFDPKASADIRQRAIDYLARKHGMDLANTKSLRYDPTFTRKDGMNTKGDIQIGPSAFKQDKAWLANVVFHESVHSDQFHYYDQNGMDFSKHSVNDEPVRVMIALDEFEGFYWTWRNAKPLGLSDAQTAELHREVQFWKIEIDDEETVGHAVRARFDAARLALIARLAKKKPAGVR